VKVTTKR